MGMTKRYLLDMGPWGHCSDGRERPWFFVEWMMSESDKKLKRTFFVEWMKAERSDKSFLQDIADKAAAVFVTRGFRKKGLSRNRALDRKGRRGQ